MTEAVGTDASEENLSNGLQSGSLTAVRSDEVVENIVERILVRATVHLPGIPLGWETYVDPANPNIQGYLSSKFLVRVERDGEL